LPLVDLLIDTRAELTELVVRSGMKVLEAMLEEDRVAVCGPRYAHQAEREAGRAGATTSAVVLGGRKVQIRRPRVRAGKQEVSLPTFEAMAQTDPLNRRIVEQMLLGVATRRYARSLEPLPTEIRSRGTSKSSVSRRFVARTTAQVRRWQTASLEDLDLVAIFLDGVIFAEHCLVVALGIDATGQKHPLGLWDGSTENATVCQGLLSNLQRRGLRTDRSLLVILDGSKALRSAVDHTFGRAACVQRCQVHIAGRNPRLPRGEMSPPGQVPMGPVVWGQTWRGNWPRRSRPDNVASVPSPEALTKSRAATKVNAFGAVNASWTSIAGRV
jgi:transposase-like protein